MKLYKIAFRNVLRNKRRSILSGVAIAVAAMSIVLLYSLLAGMMVDLEYNQQTYLTGTTRIRNSEFNKNERLNPIHLTVENPYGIAQNLKKIPGVDNVSLRINFPARIYKNDKNYNAMGLGVDFDLEKSFQNLDEEVVQAGRLPENGKNEALMSYGLAQKISLELGDKFTVLSQTASRGTNAMTFKVVGIAAFPLGSLNKSLFYAPLDRVQYFLKMREQVQEILVKSEKGYDSAPFTALVQKSLGEELKEQNLAIEEWKKISNTFALLETGKKSYDIFALFFFILGSTVILNTTIMVIYERMKEIGTMGALGMEGKEMVRLFFTESLIISVLGSLAGVLVGVILTLILGHTGIDLSASMGEIDFDVSSVLYPKINFRSTGLVFIFSVIVSSLATVIPTRRVSKIAPVEALRS